MATNPFDRRSPFQDRWLTDAATALLCGAAFSVVARLCASLPRDASHLAPIWVPNAIALTALLRTDTRRWPGLIAACMLGNLLVSTIWVFPLTTAVAIAVINAIEYGGSALVLRRLLGREISLTRARDLTLLVAVYATMSVAMAAISATWLYFHLHEAPLFSFINWAVVHPLSVLLITPCLLVLSRAREHLAEQPTRKSGMSIPVLLGCCAVTFLQGNASLLFLLPASLMFVSLEFGVFGAAVGVLATATIAVTATLTHQGSVMLTHGGALARDAVLQLFLTTALFCSLPVAGLQARQRRLRHEAQHEAKRAAAAEAAAAESEARYRMLAERANDVMLSFNLQGEYQYASPAIARTGYSDEELRGRPRTDFVHPDDRALLHDKLEALASGAHGAGAPMDFRFRCKDGGYRWLEINPQVVLDEAGRPAGFVDVARDITARKEMEAQLESARAAAEAAAAAKAEFLANMSHELRTPLTAVLGFSNLLADQEELSETARGYLERVRTAGKSLLCTVNDILDFSKLEAGQIEFSAWPTSPAALAREALGMLDAQAAAKGLQLTGAGLDDLPEAVEVDPDRIRQILVNLLGNAVKFTDRGGVRLEARYDRGRLGFRVIDSGCGIPADRLGQLFQRFSQVDGSSTRRHGGTGLGLAISKGLVEAMGGRIGVDSAVGQGSAFWFELPAAVGAAAPEPVEIQPAAVLRSQCRLLLADDTAATRELVKAILSPFHLDLSVAEDGGAAVAAAEARPFDLILMDIHMPVLDGREAAARIRAGGGPNAQTPIIAFSADVLTDASELFDGVVTKPISPMELLGALAAHLSETAEAEADQGEGEGAARDAA